MDMIQEAQPQQPETLRGVDTPGECPTCVSGLDPTIGGDLFQEALLESL